MSLRLIYGRGGSGKTTFVFNEIRDRMKDNDLRFILIVPEQYTFRTEQRVLRQLPSDAVLRVAVMSFGTLVRKVLGTVGGATHDLISSTGKVMLAAKALSDTRDELTIYKGVSKRNGFAQTAADLIDELRRFDVDPVVLSSAAEETDDSELKRKLKDISRIYGKYDEDLHRNNVDSTDEAGYAVERLEKAEFVKGAVVYIDEFNDFSVMQLKLIGKLMEASAAVTLALTLDYYDSGDGDVFSITRDTERKVMRLAEESGTSLMKPMILGSPGQARLSGNRELQHIEAEFFRYPNKALNGNIGSVSIYKAQNSYDEVERIAKDITKKVREDESLRYRDMAVLCRDIDSYSSIAQSIFNEYGIPLFLDKRRSIAGSPISIYVLSLLETLVSGFAYEPLFRMLKTGLSVITTEEADLLENYVLAHGLGSWHFFGDWKFSYPNITGSELNARYLSDVIEMRDRIAGTYSSLKDRLSECKDARDVTSVLFNHMEENGALTKAAAAARSAGEQDHTEFREVLSGINSIFDDMATVFGDEKIELPVYFEMMKAAVASYEIGLIPLTLDQVILGDVARIRSGGTKGLYILGANDGVFPRAIKDEGIFTDLDKKALKDKGVELSVDSRTRSVYEQFLIYTALTTPSGYLFLSYPSSDLEGKSLRPSMVVNRLKKIFPDLTEEVPKGPLEADLAGLEEVTRPDPTFNQLVHEMRKNYQGEDVEALWGEVYRWFREKPEFASRLDTAVRGLAYSNMAQKLPRKTIKGLYGDEMKISVSRLERFSQCPFAYFIQYGMKAKDRVLHEITAPDIGLLMHGVIDRFTEDLKGLEGGIAQADREFIHESISALVDEAIDTTNAIYKESPRYRHMGEKIKKTLMRSVDTITRQISKGDFVPRFNELGFGMDGILPPLKIDLDGEGEDVFLIGRIDRVDVLELDGKSYIRIIDYKSSAKDVSITEVFYGLQMQLLVYLDVVLKNSDILLKSGAIPGAILYFRMDDPIIDGSLSMDTETIEREVFKSLQMKGLILKDASVVRSMDREMGDYSLIVPAKITSSGEVVSKSNRKDKTMATILTEEDFDTLREYTTESIRRILREMVSGNITVLPAKNGDRIPCTYCTYSAICQFDARMPGNKYRKIVPMKIDELWSSMKETVEGGDEGGSSMDE
ncbi:MAG: helicase-exonuclease AddAB subunit AddB [Youngiibacter sp.]|nr:helicase-exonuclease AddAB subunit AddB [Youngiibacter sp.]